MHDADDDDVTSLEGPVEQVEGNLVLLIPLDAGGDQLIEVAHGVGEVEGDNLKVIIPDWLADMLRIQKGSQVSVDNKGGKFNIHPLNPMPLQ